MEHVTKSPEETRAVGRELAESLMERASLPGIPGTATIVALSGELGAGKTTFVSGVAEALGVREPITSPTFVIMKIYDVPQGAPYRRLLHLDCYRFESAEELMALDWSRYATDPGNLIFLEWPEKSAMAIPSRAHEIIIDGIDENSRRITLPDF